MLNKSKGKDKMTDNFIPKNKKLNNNNLDSSTHLPINSSTHTLLNPSTHPPIHPSTDIAIKVDHVSKKYCKSLKRSMLYGVKDIARNTFGLSSHSDKLRKNEFWALDDVSFEIKKGETLGIIGPNGSGKTTLLKMLNGIFWPDKGKISIKGKVGALIEVGAGFHPLLTGRENIYINAAILGMTKEETDKKFDAIVEFADIGDFLDVPVKHYSSGMFVRLGFAIAAHCEPDILLVDEVLAVGDISFQKKCLERIENIRKNNNSIIFVSHSLYRIEAICSRLLWLHKGKKKMISSPRDVINAYINQIEKNDLSNFFNKEDFKKATSKSYPIIINKVELFDSKGNKKNEFAFREGINIRIHYFAKYKIKKPHFNLRILNDDKSIIEASMLIDGECPSYIEGKGWVECKFKSLPLTPKVYDILIFVRNIEGILDIAHMGIYSKFRVTEKNLGQIKLDGPMALNHIRQGSPIYIERDWEFNEDN